MSVSVLYSVAIAGRIMKMSDKTTDRWFVYPVAYLNVLRWRTLGCGVESFMYYVAVDVNLENLGVIDGEQLNDWKYPHSYSCTAYAKARQSVDWNSPPL